MDETKEIFSVLVILLLLFLLFFLLLGLVLILLVFSVLLLPPPLPLLVALLPATARSATASATTLVSAALSAWRVAAAGRARAARSALGVLVFLLLVPSLGLDLGEAAVLLRERAGVEAESGELELVQRVEFLPAD